MNHPKPPTVCSRSATADLACAVFVLLLFSTVLPAQQSTKQAPLLLEPVSDFAFEQALMDRGLDVLLYQYSEDADEDDFRRESKRYRNLLDHPPESHSPARFLEGPAGLASKMLADLIRHQPDHPSRPWWQYDLAFNRLYRTVPRAFEHVLFFELPTGAIEVMHEQSAEAVTTLESLAKSLDDHWEALDHMDEGLIERIDSAGHLPVLQMLETNVATLLCWARMCELVTQRPPAADRVERFGRLIQELRDHGWLDSSAGQELVQGRALVVAAIASRHIARFDNAEEFARQAVTVMSRIENPGLRDRIDRLIVLAVLEQVRAMRDAGRVDEARRSAREVQEWLKQARPNDLEAHLAGALLTRDILARHAQRGGGRLSRYSILGPPEALQPLKVFADQSDAACELVYRALAATLENANLPSQTNTFQCQLLLGTAVATRCQSRCRDARQLVQSILGSDAETLSPARRGELEYLLGWCCIFSFDPMGAIDQFCKLVENRPGHSRSDAALEVAVRVAQGRLRTEQPPTQQTLKAFIRAVSLLEKRQPDSPEAHRLRYFLGLAFERTGRLNQAATAYGKVTPGHSNYAAAQLGQLRCHVTKIRQLSPAASADQAKLLIKQAIAQGRKRVDTLSPSDGDCVAAQIKVLLAGLYNHPAADAPQEAVDVLEDFETQHADCGNLLGTVLRERITALRQLKRLEDAREVVDQYLETDPGEAGPVMARLLDAVAQEIITARQTGDQERAEHMASEAVRLGRRLLDWSDSQAGSAVEPLSRLQIGGRYAWALLQAGKPAASLAAYQAGMDQMATLAEEVPASLRIELELGEAEALLATGEHEAALPVFMEIWRSAPEHSSIWWRAYAGSLECHAGLGHDSTTILQSIRQQRRLNPDLGGAGIKRRLSTLEKGLEAVSAVQSARPD